MAQRTRERNASGQFIVADPEVRFWASVDQTSDGCWEWTSRRVPDGYGMAYIGQGTRSFQVAHRTAWELTYGLIPDGAIVRHRCDNPPCCNPAHLQLGTQADNIADKVRRGRQAKGERIGTAKLTEEQVVELRAMRARGEGIPAIMARFNLSRTHAYRLARGEGWRHIKGDESEPGMVTFTVDDAGDWDSLHYLR